MPRLQAYVQDPITGEWERPQYGDTLGDDTYPPPSFLTIPLVNRTPIPWETGLNIIQYLLASKTMRRYLLKQVANTPVSVKTSIHLTHPLLLSPVVLKRREGECAFCWKLKVHEDLERQALLEGV